MVIRSRNYLNRKFIKANQEKKTIMIKSRINYLHLQVLIKQFVHHQTESLS